MNKPKILIIDDDPEWCEDTLKTPLINRQCEIVTVKERAKALELMQNEIFDLVILNVQLEFEKESTRIIQSWAEVLDLVKQRKAEAIIVASRSFPADIQVDRLVRMAFKEYGVVDFIVKEDFKGDDYCKRVQEALASAKVKKWKVEFCGVPYTIEEGIHRDMVNGLEETLVLDKIFDGVKDYRGKLWAILSNSQDDRAYGYTADLWTGLWAQEGGLPPFAMIQLLAQQEYSGQLYKGYRDHVVHSFLVYLLGIYLYHSSPCIQEAFNPMGDQAQFLTAWKIAALFHDIGYYLNVADAQATEGAKRLLLEKLQEFIHGPLQNYGKLCEAFTLQESDEREICWQAQFIPPWNVISMADLRKAFPPAEGHILDELDSLVVGVSLADAPDGRLLHHYDLYTQMVDADTHPRCDDHGLLGAMILLGQYKYFQKYTQATCKNKILKKVRGIKPETRQFLLQLPEKIKGLATEVHQAAAAIALHNINVTGWTKNDPDWATARSYPYFLTLDQYKLSLSKTPLAWLLCLADALQCWERPSRTDAPLESTRYSLKHQEIRIISSPEGKVAITFTTDPNPNVPASRFNKIIHEMEKYMQDLDILEEGH